MAPLQQSNEFFIIWSAPEPVNHGELWGISP